MPCHWNLAYKYSFILRLRLLLEPVDIDQYIVVCALKQWSFGYRISPWKVGIIHGIRTYMQHDVKLVLRGYSNIKCFKVVKWTSLHCGQQYQWMLRGPWEWRQNNHCLAVLINKRPYVTTEQIATFVSILAVLFIGKTNRLRSFCHLLQIKIHMYDVIDDLI